VSSSADVVNLDWSPYLRIARNPLLRRVAPLFLDRERRQRLREVGGNVVVHDLKRGIPWPDSSVDAVYHSHLLEHLDRAVAGDFLAEVFRVLRPGGVQRVVVPDLETLAREYIESLEAGDAPQHHEERIAAMIEQSVRREAYGTAQKPPLRRAIENLLLGDARRRGETHQWMYDRLNLRMLLKDAGFVDIQQRSYDSSGITQWDSYGLDRNSEGAEYKPGSLYMEAMRPI
jgi:SAM-dependent methyltransferase